MRSLVRRYQNSALGERFQQILDEQMASLLASQLRRDPTLSRMNPEGTKADHAQGNDTDRSKNGENDAKSAFLIAQTENSLQSRKFAHVYQKEIAYVASEPLLQSQSARSTAETITRKPWDGVELTPEAALRMLTDSVPRAKPVARQRNQDRIISPPVPWQDRVKSAKELSIDYKVGKPDSERDGFREMYRERLLGPSMFVDSALPKATLGLIGTLADARINAAIDQRTGKFETPDMDSVRGKPLDRARLANSNDTTFFINDILNRQDCLPPWIESQQGAERGVLAFRRDLQKKWFTVLVAKLGKEKMAALEKCHTLAFQDISSHLKEYKRLNSHYIEEKILALNREIRSYNLQCPSPSLHKWKLIPETEIQTLFETVMRGIEQLISEWFEAQKRPPDDPKMLGIFDLEPVRLSEPRREKLEIWKLVKLIFGRG